MDKSTKILCTIGPSSSSLATLKKLYKEGMNAVRINTAHGSFEQYKTIIKRARAAAKVPIILDIKGPELRLRCEKEYEFKKGEEFSISFTPKKGIHFSHNVSKKLKKNDVLLVSDGKYILTVKKVSSKEAIVQTKSKTKIEPNKSINVPNRSLDLPQLSSKDIKAVDFAIKEKIEYIALSFVRNKKDVLHLRKKLAGSGIRIISKIENSEGVNKIDEIIKYSDGIMVARGDLGVELPTEKVPLIQKQIVRSCNKQAKLVIVATQMLESMIQSPSATRAEISDVANGILDGADCLMLSGETAIGKYPVEAVKAMTKVAKEVEPNVRKRIPFEETANVSESITLSAYTLTKTLPINKIVCVTNSGYTARKIARFRFPTPIIALTHSEQVKRQLMLYYGIHPVASNSHLWDSPIKEAVHFLSKEKLIKNTELVLFTAGLNVLKGKTTNTVQVHNIGDLLSFSKKEKNLLNLRGKNKKILRDNNNFF